MFLICEQTRPLSSVTHCSVMCHHILLTSAKTHLYMLIHKQVSMPGRSKEELPENTATWKQARKGNTAQQDMVILKINTNSKHLGCFLQNYFHESWPLLQHLTCKDLEVPINKVRKENTSSTSMRSRYHLKYYGWRWTGDCTEDHSCSLGESEWLFQSKCYWGQTKECYPAAAANVAWVFQEHYN